MIVMLSLKCYQLKRMTLRQEWRERPLILLWLGPSLRAHSCMRVMVNGYDGDDGNSDGNDDLDVA